MADRLKALAGNFAEFARDRITVVFRAIGVLYWTAVAIVPARLASA